MKRTAEHICAWLIDAPAPALAVGILSDDELLRVRGYLGRIYRESAMSGELLGLCLVEESARWEKLLKETTQ